MVSKTSLAESVRGYRFEEVKAGLVERPDLLALRDDRGRTWLHLVCMAPLKPEFDPTDGIRIADLLIGLGLDLNDAAFTEGKWRATPLWHCIARGRNMALARAFALAALQSRLVSLCRCLE